MRHVDELKEAAEVYEYGMLDCISQDQLDLNYNDGSATSRPREQRSQNEVS